LVTISFLGRLVILIVPDHKFTSFPEKFIFEEEEVLPGVPEGPNPPKIGSTPLGCPNLQKSASKQPKRCPKTLWTTYGKRSNL
jgi:hypothetical protein